jgi:hypothetical protein
LDLEALKQMEMIAGVRSEEFKRQIEEELMVELSDSPGSPLQVDNGRGFPGVEEGSGGEEIVQQPSRPGEPSVLA